MTPLLHEVRLAALDVTLGLRLPAALADAPRPWLPGGVVEVRGAEPVAAWITLDPGPAGEGAAASYRLVDSDGVLDEIVEAGEIDASLEWAVIATLARRVQGYVFLHAGVVAWGGRAILLPGRSHAGKSTLTAALVRAGADYYSDDCAALGPDGHVHPISRRLALRRPDGQMDRVDVRAWGARVGGSPTPVGLIVATRHVAHARWQPRALTPGEAVQAMVEHAIGLARQPARTLAALAAIAQAAPAFEGTRGEAAAVVEWCLRSLGTGAAAVALR